MTFDEERDPLSEAYEQCAKAIKRAERAEASLIVEKRRSERLRKVLKEIATWPFFLAADATIQDEANLYRDMFDSIQILAEETTEEK